MLIPRNTYWLLDGAQKYITLTAYQTIPRMIPLLLSLAQTRFIDFPFRGFCHSRVIIFTEREEPTRLRHPPTFYHSIEYATGHRDGRSDPNNPLLLRLFDQNRGKFSRNGEMASDHCHTRSLGSEWTGTTYLFLPKTRPIRTGPLSSGIFPSCWCECVYLLCLLYYLHSIER